MDKPGGLPFPNSIIAKNAGNFKQNAAVSEKRERNYFVEGKVDRLWKKRGVWIAPRRGDGEKEEKRRVVHKTFHNVKKDIPAFHKALINRAGCAIIGAWKLPISEK